MFNISIMNTISEQLINLRKSAGVTQMEIAEHIGKTIGAICNYEKGRRPIRASDFERIKQYCQKKAGAQVTHEG